MLYNRVVFILFFSVFSIFAASCSSSDKLPDDPAALYQEAQKYENDERYEEALRRYEDLKNRFPYSNYATQARLSIADCYYKQETYAEAQLSYQTFRELHPRHPRTDYVIFKTGMSYFQQLPSSIDRDISLANDAISSFDELQSKFPGSDHINEARENREKALRMLAEKEKYIADFYYIRNKWEPAFARYVALYEKFKGVAFEPIALSRAAICADKIGAVEERERYFTLLQDEHPQSSELVEAKRELLR